MQNDYVNVAVVNRELFDGARRRVDKVRACLPAAHAQVHSFDVFIDANQMQLIQFESDVNSKFCF